jgi:hypothetical protein
MIYEKASKLILKLIKWFIRKVEMKNETNSQWFLDFLDEINKQSVRY